ncbi:MAG: LysM peptidoglycan-binding domain-containing protein [Clostridia bacterium]|nr:LysM peptidoglycan-binding domain-containing protein [Clostridia bacterium]
MLLHTVKYGESVGSIAAKHHISQSKIIEDNSLLPPYSLAEGETLLISLPSSFHTVYGGETEELIAEKYNTDIDTLKLQNPAFCQTGRLYPGQVLSVSFPERIPASTICVLEHLLPLPSFLALLPFFSFIALGGSLYKEEWIRFAKEGIKRGVMPLFYGKKCPEELLPYAEGCLYQKEKDTFVLDMEKRGERTEIHIDALAGKRETCFLSLDRPLLVNGDCVSPELLPRYLKRLRQGNGRIQRKEDGMAYFTLTEHHKKGKEEIEVCFFDGEKEKAVLEAKQQEGFCSFILRDEKNWPMQSRLLFASLFAPIKWQGASGKGEERFDE